MANRLAVGGIGLGELVAEPFALTGIRWLDLRRQGQLGASLVKVFAWFHHLGAEPDRFVAWMWIRQIGREVRRVEGVTVARGGGDEDGDLRPGSPDGVRSGTRTVNVACPAAGKWTHGEEPASREQVSPDS